MKKGARKLVLLGGIIALCYTLFPIIFLGKGIYYVGADGYFHYGRFLGLVESLKQFELFPHLNPVIGSGHNYGDPMFYSQLFFYPFAIISALGVSPVWMWSVLYFCLNLSLFYSAFFSFRKLGIASSQAGIGSIIFLTAPLVVQFSVRGQMVGQVQAFIFCPLLFLALEKLFSHQYKYWILLVFAMFGIAMSHVLSLVLSIIVILIYGIVNFSKINRTVIFSVFKAAFVTVGLVTFYYLPMLEQLAAQTFRVHSVTSYYLSNEAHDVQTLLKYLVYPGIKPSVGFFCFIGFVITVFYSLKEKRQRRTILFCGLLFSLTTKLFPWQLFDGTSLNTIQFPWRFYAFLLFPIVYLLLQFLSRKYLILILMGNLLLFGGMIMGSTLPYLFPDSIFTRAAFIANPERTIDNDRMLYDEEVRSKMKDKDEFGWQLFNMIKNYHGTGYALGTGREYLNERTAIDSVELLENFALSHSDEVQTTILKRQLFSFEFLYEAKTDKPHKIITPYLWYKGYQSDAGPVQQASNGFAEITVSRSGHGRIWYEGTKIQTLSAVTSLTFGVFYMALIRKEAHCYQLSRKSSL